MSPINENMYRLFNFIFSCGWCPSTKTCQLSRDCSFYNEPWLGRDGVCPEPKITRFTPTRGPLSGGTLLTVHGMNLGKHPDELLVSVAGKNCEVVVDAYVASRSFVCVTGSTHAKAFSNIVITSW